MRGENVDENPIYMIFFLVCLFCNVSLDKIIHLMMMSYKYCLQLICMREGFTGICVHSLNKKNDTTCVTEDFIGKTNKN